MAHEGPNSQSVTQGSDCSEGKRKGQEDQGWAMLSVEVMEGLSEERPSEQNQE